ncbi:MAG: hypothetical protein LBT43_09570 [Prevotella sp.]|jgi:hypothetical protein|nr:hypothetical protein [Prevotella sp.]
MKIEILIRIDCLKSEVFNKYPDMINCIINWDYPVLPRVNENVNHIECFITDEVKEDLSQRTVDTFFIEKYINNLYSKEDQRKISVFDFLSDRLHIVKAIYWNRGEDNKPIPCIFISLE